MLVLYKRELKYAMPASIGVQSPQRIRYPHVRRRSFRGVRRLPSKRRISSWGHYDTIAKRFESHSCGSPSLPKDDDPLTKTKPCTLTSEISNRFDFDHSATPMWVFDHTTFAFSAVNDAAVDHYGYSRKEFLSMTLLDIHPSEDIVPLLRDVMRQGRHNSATQLRRHKKKDGNVIDVEVTRCETMFNGRVADIMTAVDVIRKR